MDLLPVPQVRLAEQPRLTLAEATAPIKLTNTVEEEDAWREGMLAKLPADAQAKYTVYCATHNPPAEYRDAALIVLANQAPKQVAIPVDVRLSQEERAALAHLEPEKTRRDAVTLCDVIDDLLVMGDKREKFGNKYVTLKARTKALVKRGTFQLVLDSLQTLEGISFGRRNHIFRMLTEYQRRFGTP